ncbi:MAG: carboxylating nicotinate-nucleotide diphosphorylase [Candidatus Krumholzibacteria bacterium]|nr:carboxylating nicotinate-nucleotide diphosphorylase [Candidatus Krumholzibacteria bacterium]
MSPQVESTFPAGDWLVELVRQSLAEDIGAGDATTAVTVDRSATGLGVLAARESGSVAGLPLLDLLFSELDPAVQVNRLVADGAEVQPGQVVAHLTGPLGSILTGERTALNFLQHLGGIATLTAQYVAAVAGTNCQVLDTRKTLPGYRALAKYAVRCGGGHNHRMGLYDRVMLKDNHWAAAGGAINELVARSRALFPDLAVEVEVDSLSQLAQVLPLQVEWVLLDNFDFESTAEAVRMRAAAGSSTRLESSGNVDLETIGGYARAGVDAASVGRLTHSAPALDLGLDMEQA